MKGAAVLWSRSLSSSSRESRFHFSAGKTPEQCPGGRGAWDQGKIRSHHVEATLKKYNSL